MKRLYKLILLLSAAVILGQAKVCAQAHLRIQQLNNYPDTAYHGLVSPVSAIVTNTGNAPYTGTIQIAYNSNPAGTFGYLVFSSNTLNLLPQDTAYLATNGYMFDSTFYKMGNNVVVVWPYTTQAVVVDSFYTSVYFDTNPGIVLVKQHMGIHGLEVYPVPATDKLFIHASEDLGSVRIFDLSGREVFTNYNCKNEMILNIEGLLPGMYFAEITGNHNSKSVIRFIKLNE